jgi:hypothetical protein
VSGVSDGVVRTETESDLEVVELKSGRGFAEFMFTGVSASKKRSWPMMGLYLLMSVIG